MKTCFRCGKEKPRSEFYRHKMMADGRLGKCKDCTKSDVSANYRERKGQYVAYEKERYERPERKAASSEYRKAHRSRYPERYKARTAVGNAVRGRRLERQPCEVCGTEPAQAHHDDYSKPLDVRWLCFRHHQAEHGKEAFG